GGGRIARLTIQGGLHGVEGEQAISPTGAPGILPAPIVLRRIAIAGSTRGVFGAFSDLAIVRATITDTSWNGIATTVAGALTTQTTVVKNAGGVGILVTGANNGAGHIDVLSVKLVDNRNGGLVVEAFGQPVLVRNSEFD